MGLGAEALADFLVELVRDGGAFVQELCAGWGELHDLNAAVGGAAGAGDCAAVDELVGEGNDEAGGYAELGGDVALGVGESGVHYGEESYLFVAEAEFFDSSAEFLGDVGAEDAEFEAGGGDEWLVVHRVDANIRIDSKMNDSRSERYWFGGPLSSIALPPWAP